MTDFYIPYRILFIHEESLENESDPIFMRSMQLVFEWANKMGLEGKKVHSLTLQKPSSKEYFSLRQYKSLWCKIECDENDREKWNEIRELHIKQCVLDELKEEENK